MLSYVSNEISTYLKYYTDFEKIEREVDKWERRNYQQQIFDEKECLE
jgi:hypothetical protein